MLVGNEANVRQGLLYRGHKVLPYCPQTGTSYSSHEVALGYKEVEEPSVYVKFKLIDDSASILAWTTTPWTLPGNVGLAVGPNVTYVRVKVTEQAENWTGAGGASVDEEVILAKDLMKEVLRHNVEVLEEFPGSSLVGRAYEPLFSEAVPEILQPHGPFLKRIGSPQLTVPASFTPQLCTVKTITTWEWRPDYLHTIPWTWMVRS